MTANRAPFRFLLLAAIVALAACSDLDQPMGPGEPAFNAQANGRAASAQELRAWFAMASPEVMGLPQTVYGAVDDRAGVLVFGVENANAARGVQNALLRRGVPATTMRIEVAEPIHYMNTTLRTAHRPTVGGIQIHFTQYVCTLGFNVSHAGGRSFVTNSHCTANQGTTGSTLYYQPSSSADPAHIAVEAHDPAYTRLSGCSAGKQCRYSDAARALYTQGTSSSQGVIAKTTGENNGSLSVSGAFTIAEQNNTSTTYSGTVHKVGRTTGWSSGNVTNTCATVNVSGSNIQLLCQTIVQRSGTVIVEGGDSGSPVFQRMSGDNVRLVGILWGGGSNGSLFVFSPLKNIIDELGPMTATSGGTSPPPGGGDEDPPCRPRGNSGNCR